MIALHDDQGDVFERIAIILLCLVTKRYLPQVEVSKSSSSNLHGSGSDKPKRFINDTLIVALSVLVFLAIVW